ncbi:Glycogen synthase [Commensalibacter sp. Nvir]|uniref:glycogen synthase GlgA n=1 Tax=Commensalibacter sp. Nvir TaxID=3069817 RepID=UPI002D3A6024|nr:Glycogen synthase [Commensalibacter sp. Nvir]
MKILHVCSEFFPLLKTGGLADVMGALPMTQRKLGHDARILIPGFPDILHNVKNKQEIACIQSFVGPCKLYACTYRETHLFIIDCPSLYNRPGSPYHDKEHVPYHDNHLRFALLGYIACEIAKDCYPYWKPDIIHAHDWHAGLTCAYLAANQYPAKCVFTVHNIAYQGLFAPYHLKELWLPQEFYSSEGLEFYGQISFLKAGLYYANTSTTVSPTYAREILHPKFSCGLDLLLKKLKEEKRLCGILNRVDETVWSPKYDEFIAQSYSWDELNKKNVNKVDLQKKLGLSIQNQWPLFTVISRMTYQKGLDLIIKILPRLAHFGLQCVVVGHGDKPIEKAFEDVAHSFPDQIKVIIGYNEPISHRVIAGGDVLIIPSRYEPCGLTQLYGLKYGTLPLVRKTGGLADTVVDCSSETLANQKATGFVFNECTPFDLLKTVHRALLLWKIKEQWHQVQQEAMQQDLGWRKTAKKYDNLYASLLNH